MVTAPSPSDIGSLPSAGGSAGHRDAIKGAAVVRVQNAVARHPALQGKHILVVEDETLVGMLAEDQLLEAGADVVGPAASVGEALRLIEAAVLDGGIDAAVLDVKLRDGLVQPVADRLTALGVPFVIATGYSMAGDAGVFAGAPMLHKPFDPDELATALEALTSREKHV